jgi:hypothetical protein
LHYPTFKHSLIEIERVILLYPKNLRSKNELPDRKKKKEIGIENGIGIEKSNEKSPQLRTKNVAFLSLRREKPCFTVKKPREVKVIVKKPGFFTA